MKIQKQHLLLVPVQQMTQVIIRPLTYQEDADLVKESLIKDANGNPEKDKNGQDKINSEKLLELRSCKMTGLSESELLELAQPDINTIEYWNHIFTTQDSETVARLLEISVDKKPWSVGNNMKPCLLQALDGCDSYALKYPTGRLTKAMNAQKTDDDRTFTITAGCTDLSHDQIYQLTTPDWTYLQNRLTDFLSQQADYFRR
ncbi:hypothetical protein [Vibrio echinoideorum]|uniref:hypothetical protein n=1 Tax=Vibrio echinoideorum TaxID=2100116 RepID=UPI003550101A